MHPEENQVCCACGRALDSRAEGAAALVQFCSSRCRDLWEVRDAFDRRLPEIAVLGRGEREEADRAISIIDELRATWLGRDHDGWLDRSTRSHRAMILAECRRYDEALDDLRAVDLRTAPGSDDYALNKQAIAALLARAGRPHEAIAELDSALIARERLCYEVIGGLLVTYAEIAAEAGVDVPSAYSDDAMRAIDAWGLSADSELLSCSLRDALLHAESLMAQAQKRYNALRRAARNKPSEIATAMVKEYINEEPVGQYRERAMRFLESLMRQPGTQS